MKKTILTLIITFAALFTSCSKDDNPTVIDETIYPIENPFETFLTLTGLNQMEFVNIDQDPIGEFGYGFKPNVKGKITSVIVKIPDINNSLRLTIWDVSANAVIKTEIINVEAANTITTKNITPIDLIKDKEYAITINTGDYYGLARTDLAVINYPIVAGNVTFLNRRTNGQGTLQVLPNPITSSASLRGKCSFTFQQIK